MDQSAKTKEGYILQNCSPEDPLLAELNRQTWLKMLNSKMISGHYQGKFLEMVSYMIRPSQILEIGTYTGYSAICLGRGLKEGGQLHTIDSNDEIREFASGFIRKSGMQDRIVMHTGNALEIIPTLEGPFDLIFIDGGKSEYSDYYDLVFPRVREGGFIIADNALWDDKVYRPEYSNDKDTVCIKDFNEMISRDTRVENLLLSIRDGLMIIRKKHNKSSA